MKVVKIHGLRVVKNYPLVFKHRCSSCYYRENINWAIGGFRCSKNILKAPVYENDACSLIWSISNNSDVLYVTINSTLYNDEDEKNYRNNELRESILGSFRWCVENNRRNFEEYEAALNDSFGEYISKIRGKLLKYDRFKNIMTRSWNGVRKIGLIVNILEHNVSDGLVKCRAEYNDGISYFYWPEGSIRYLTINELREIETEVNVGSKVRLGMHNVINGYSNFSNNMNKYVGTECTVIKKCGVDEVGCELAMVSGNMYKWRTMNMQVLDEQI